MNNYYSLQGTLSPTENVTQIPLLQLPEEYNHANLQVAALKVQYNYPGGGISWTGSGTPIFDGTTGDYLNNLHWYTENTEPGNAESRQGVIKIWHGENLRGQYYELIIVKGEILSL